MIEAVNVRVRVAKATDMLAVLCDTVVRVFCGVVTGPNLDVDQLLRPEQFQPPEMPMPMWLVGWVLVSQALASTYLGESRCCWIWVIWCAVHSGVSFVPMTWMEFALRAQSIRLGVSMQG